MRSVIISVLAAGHLILGVQPALAATLGPGEQSRIGVFGGVQVRVPLGSSRAEAPRASLGIAPVARSQRLDGESRMRIGEGLQFSLQPNRPVELNLAGTRLDRLGLVPGGQAQSGRQAGVSTLGWVAIGVAATAVLVVGAAAICFSDSDCLPSE